MGDEPTSEPCSRWTTRYLYDLTAGGTVSVGASAAYHAYGGLYKTQELLPTGVPNPQWAEAGSVNGPSTGTTNPSWQDTAGTAFDALDRPTVQYRNTGSALMPVTNSYDAPGSLGLLSRTCNASSECQSFTYDARGAKLQASFNVGSSSAQTFGYDENGHIASASNAVGTISDLYDADGRKTARTEQVGGQSATISYAYYADGLRSSLAITTGTQLLSNALAYTYSPLGLVRSIAVAGTSTFGFTYTGGRRLTSRSDSTGQAAETFSYANSSASPTSYGLAQAVNAAGFYETGITYNAEGGQLAGGIYTWNAGWLPAASVNNVYTSRNELSTGNQLFANGTQIPDRTSLGTSTPKTATFQFNAFQGFPVQSDSPNLCGAACEENDSASAFSYDPVGRQIQLGPNPSWNGSQPGLMNSKTYDAESHLLSEAFPWITSGSKTAGYAQSLGYRWGPLEHPLQVGSTSAQLTNQANPIQQPSDFQYDTLYWDDDDLLLTENPAGNVDDIKVGDFADYVPGASAPLTVWERDISGQIRGCHNTGGASGANTTASQNPPMSCGVAASSFIFPKIGNNTTAVGRGGILVIEKSDGLSDGQNTFQGVRTYDTQAGVWTTPDAYRGDVHDPMSQKPYMWNRNNPYSYSDPTGYQWEHIDSGVQSYIDTLLLKSRTFKAAYDAVQASPLKFSIILVPAEDVRRMHIPGHENDGIAQTQLTRDPKTGEYNGAIISIGRSDSRLNMFGGIGEETFNASRIATDLTAYLKDYYTADDKWGNVAEKVGAEAQAKIISELPRKEY